MRKEKGKYLINRNMYKDIKKFDHQQMENFLTDIYKGRYAGVPFLYGVWHHDGIGTKFEYNIIGRKLKCFKIEDKKEFAMPLKTKVDAFGNRLMVCPNCESTAVVKPSRKVFELYPYCPWCGQKLKGEDTDEQR